MTALAQSRFEFVFQMTELVLSFSEFTFSKDEPTALVQLDGGPCAVIAPLQAYLLKALIFDSPKEDWRNISGWLAYFISVSMLNIFTVGVFIVTKLFLSQLIPEAVVCRFSAITIMCVTLLIIV